MATRERRNDINTPSHVIARPLIGRGDLESLRSR